MPGGGDGPAWWVRGPALGHSVSPSVAVSPSCGQQRRPGPQGSVRLPERGAGHHALAGARELTRGPCQAPGRQEVIRVSTSVPPGRGQGAVGGVTRRPAAPPASGRRGGRRPAPAVSPVGCAATAPSAGASRAQCHTLQAGFSSRSQGLSGETSVSDALLARSPEREVPRGGWAPQSGRGSH